MKEKIPFEFRSVNELFLTLSAVRKHYENLDSALVRAEQDNYPDVDELRDLKIQRDEIYSLYTRLNDEKNRLLRKYGMSEFSDVKI